MWTLVGWLILFWFLGLIARVGGGLVHGLLVIALLLALYRLLTNRR